MVLRVLSGLSLLTAACALASCLGDDPQSRTSPPEDAGAAATDAGADASPGTADGAAPDGSPAADAGVDAPPGPKLAFATSGQYTGILAGGNGGLAAGDKACGDEALRAGRQGSFKALLSTSAVTGIKRIGQGPWALADGSPVAARDALTTSVVVINRDASGGLVDGVAWTGCDTSGEAAADTCTNWSDPNASLGQVGDVGGAGATWLSSGTRPCSDMRRIYCFED